MYSYKYALATVITIGNLLRKDINTAKESFMLRYNYQKANKITYKTKTIKVVHKDTPTVDKGKRPSTGMNIDIDLVTKG